MESGPNQDKLWDEFLQQWPIERLSKMTLAEYSTAGDKKCFVQWMEIHLDKMGSIWGGSAFKFGIYHRKATEKKVDGGGRTYAGEYAWYTKYGKTAEEAFDKVRALVMATAVAARAGDLEEIESIDLGDAFKWKIAFHYQNRLDPSIVGIYSRRHLELFQGDKGGNDEGRPDLYRALQKLRAGRDLLDFGKEVWDVSDKIVSEQTLAAEQAKALLATGGPHVGEAPTLDKKVQSMDSLNQILYGPPGTGKTFHAVTRALAILDSGYLEQHKDDRVALKSRYDQLTKERRVRFVTFHQSFSYEDFVEGIRADGDTDEGKGLTYRVEPGIFRQIAEEALLKRQGGTGHDIPPGAKVWKVSIGRTHAVQMREECFKRGEMRIGWGETGDLLNPNRPKSQIEAFEESSWTDQNSMLAFSEGMTKGDVVLCLKSQTSIQAIGIVDGDYRFDEKEQAIWDTFFHIRPVKWLAIGLDIDILKANGGVRLTLKTVYQLTRIEPADALLLANLLPSQDGPSLPYVLIIDEINRGNVSRILGELITLLEESKRFGRPEALSAILPYSKREFWVPDNLYVIGTMNTADRSLTGLDIALRRRFVFEEMPPIPEQLNGVRVSGISVQSLLETMNARIEVLLDRDRRIGHTYFLPLKEDSTLECLAGIFRRQVLPLLQEYFFEDWERIRWVLNDHRKAAELQFIVRPPADSTGLFGADVSGQVEDRRWSVNSSALLNAESYLRVIA